MTRDALSMADVMARLIPMIQDISDNPARDIRMLLAFIEGRMDEESAPYTPPSYNHSFYFFQTDYTVPRDVYAALIPLIQRLQRHEPLSKIIGQREFYSRRFFVNQHTLDPRPDTETLVDGILKCLPILPRPLRILDLGTGSGCIVLTLMKEIIEQTGEPVLGVGIDLSQKALDIAQKNAVSLGVESYVDWYQGSWCDPLVSRPQTFSCVVSNPPYIREDEKLDTRVLNYDPPMALFSKEDGLAAYTTFAPQLPKYLAPGGVVGVEFGQGQDRAVRAVFEKHGYSSIHHTHHLQTRDLQGIIRCDFFKRTDDL